MYFLFWIIVVVSNKKTNSFVLFHLKQAMWWWMVFVMSVLLSIVLLFIPVIKIFSIFWLLALLVFFVVFCKQSWDGKVYESDAKYVLAIFPSLWSWLLWLFDVNFDIKNNDDLDLSENRSTQK
jgi:hypothetical protein